MDFSDDAQDNLMFHLARYKFISRLIRKTDRLLEVGCGTGYGSRLLADFAAQVVASDADDEVFEYAKGVYPCGKWLGGVKRLCGPCTAKAEREFPQGWSGYPGDTCSHGVYVGGCGIDYMCGACEAGDEPADLAATNNTGG